MGRIFIPRPRLLQGCRVASVTTTGEQATSTAWDTDLRTRAALCYFTNAQNAWLQRENPPGLFGTIAGSFATGRDTDGGGDAINTGNTFWDGAEDRFAWAFDISNGFGNDPDFAYCILKERAVLQTSGWQTRDIGSGVAYDAVPNPIVYGSRSNATSPAIYPFYAYGYWPRVLTVDEMTRLGRWDVPHDPVAFILNDVQQAGSALGRDLSGNGHHVTYNDLTPNGADFQNPVLRIPQ